MKSEITNDRSVSRKLVFPVAMKWTHDNHNHDDEFKAGKKQLVVLFFGEKEGTCIHQVGTWHEIGEFKTDWSAIGNENWSPFDGTISIQFP